MLSSRVVVPALFLGSLLLACGGTDGSVDDDGIGSTDEMSVKGKTGDGFPGAYASPTIFREGSKYHAYFAKQTIDGKHYHVPVATFDAAGKFKAHGDALPHLGKHAKDDGVVWAPAAAKIGDHYMLYYASDLEGTDQKKCIWRARSDDPNGPFVDDYDGPIECEPGSLWAIDPYLVQGNGGDWYLSARIDQPGGINTIQIRKLGPGGQSYAPGSEWKVLTRNAPNSWEQPVLENAGIVYLTPPGKTTGHWLVVYSGRAWATNSYALGYADCGETIIGDDRGAGEPRCKKITTNGPWLDTNAAKDLYGPGTPTFYTDESGAMMMSVQAWQHSGGKANKKNNGQIMRTYEIGVDDGFDPHVRLTRIDL